MKTEPALAKVHSSWITDSIIAMQRPNDEMFVCPKLEGEEGGEGGEGLLEQFKRIGVRAVFNLTEPGEHALCGHGNIGSTGFPYSPEKLMAKGIKHFNYAWPDMTAPSTSLMMDIVQVAGHELKEGGKLAVHCHAGYGRTGIAIACMLIASERMAEDEAIQCVRTRRPGSIQTSAQKNFIHEFSLVYRSMQLVFPLIPEGSSSPSPPTFSKSIALSIREQQQFLSLHELTHRKLRWVHKIVAITSFALSSSSSVHVTPFSVACALVGYDYATDAPHGSPNLILSSSSWTDCLQSIKAECNINEYKRLQSTALTLGPFVTDAALLSPKEEPAATATVAAAAEGGEKVLAEEADLSLAVPFDTILLAQLLLDWIETRSDAIFGSECVASLDAVWRAFDEMMPTDSTTAAATVGNTQVQTHLTQELGKHLDKPSLALVQCICSVLAFVGKNNEKVSSFVMTNDLFSLACIRFGIACTHTHAFIPECLSNRSLSPTFAASLTTTDPGTSNLANLVCVVKSLACLSRRQG